MHTASPREQVVLVDDDARPIGVADKTSIHTADTPLHLAFSCHVSRPDGLILMTRRALSKIAWPGVWTNAFCGHPAPGESMHDAVQRRAHAELGISVRDVRVILPDFHYVAYDASGICENEVCPVFTAVTDDEPRPNPHEVVEYRWTSAAEVDAAVRAAPWAFSPWLGLQLDELREPGRTPRARIGEVVP